ncbi:response regulator [Gracilibacillus oryzae]|uniref:response regulator n=1 Tax=Gracilibacillus oryzae TaxID=1672701 RepID=UPI0018863588|nr:response regulator [Gracilibacillus oryzae]
MIKVLLVEDDKLVRKSLIATFDWNAFNMEIVGDAKNGEKAVEFLENNAVDLLITDLAMPVMSGIELIRVVKERFPQIFIVVLSLHRDFEYIQEALRLGAIDYIAKVELDSDNMDRTLDRIKTRINEEIKKSQQSMDWQNFSNGLMVLFENMTPANKQLIEDVVKKAEKTYLSADSLFIPLENEKEQSDFIQRMEAVSNWDEELLVIPIINQSSKISQLQELVHQYKETSMFYELSPTIKVKIIEIDHIGVSVDTVKQSEGMKSLREELLLLHWVYKQSALEELLAELKQLRLPKNKLNDLLIMTINECRRIYADILSTELTLPDAFHSWYEVENWFFQIKEQIHETIFKKTVPHETSQYIIKAIHLIDNQLSDNITATDMGMQVNMSRSYFCTCFKQVIGITFHEYVKVLRINKAKNYLEHTVEKVSSIAEKVGYSDVKYFSKVFKQETGFLPSEYRKKWRRL